MKLSFAMCALLSSAAAASGVRAQDSSIEQKLRDEIVSLKQAHEDLRLKLRELELQNRELMLSIREMRLDVQVLTDKIRSQTPMNTVSLDTAPPPSSGDANVEARLELAKNAEEPDPPIEIDASRKEAHDLLQLAKDLESKQRDYPQAVEVLSRAIALNPFEYSAFFYRGVAHHYLKHYVEAMADFTTAAEYSEAGPVRLASLYNIACGHAVLGNRGHALSLLEKALSEGFGEFNHIREDPDLQSIREDPRFLELMKTYDRKNTEEGP